MAGSPLRIVVILFFAYLVVPVIVVITGKTLWPDLLLNLSGFFRGDRSILSNGVATVAILTAEFAVGVAVLVLIAAKNSWHTFGQLNKSERWSAFFLASTNFTIPSLVNVFVLIILLGVPIPKLSADPASLTVGQSTVLTATTYNEPPGATIEIVPLLNLNGRSHHCSRSGRRLACTESFVSTKVGLFTFDAVTHLSGNLVPDSNLANASAQASQGWTSYTFGGKTPIQYGNANGNFSIKDGVLTYLGTGAEAPNGFIYSQIIGVAAGGTYTISALIDARNVLQVRRPGVPGGYSPAIAVYNAHNLGIPFAEVQQIPGAKGQIFQTFTIPKGITEVVAAYYVKLSTVAKGMPLTFSNIDLFQASTNPEVFNLVTVTWKN